MKQNHFKLIRVVVSLLLLLCVSAVFMDLLGNIAVPAIKSIFFLQFTPSFINYISSAAWISSGFIVILILTLFCGRIYCSFICPLGAMQDIFIRIFKHFRLGRHTFSYQPPLNLLRFSILAATAMSCIAGSFLLLSILDPFSQFGRIISDLARPIVISAYNALVAVFQWADIFVLYPLTYKAPDLSALLLPLFILIFIACFTAQRGRLFCNSFCPVGSLLALISQCAFFKIRVNEQLCTQCGQCKRRCKAECINIKKKFIDFSRCISCFNCMQHCPEGAINYQLSVRHQTDRNKSHGQERRIILASLFSFFFFRSQPGKSQPSKLKEVVRNRLPSTVVNDKHYPVLPPGAISINHILTSCTACHLCISTCPTGVLQPVLTGYGPNGFLKPHLDPLSGFCNFDCTRCGEVCPTGAIQILPISKKRRIQMGKAQFIKKNCVVETDKKDCGACAEHCPTKAVRMVVFEKKLKIPELDNTYCIGCGACEHICPVRPHKAIFVEGLPVQGIAKPPVSKPATLIPMEDFPF